MSQTLSKSLKKRHLTMISIGGVIGAGLFVASGSAIQKVGPGVVISYAITGLLVVLVMRMLGELAVNDPDSGSFSAYAEKTFGPRAGFVVGWLYWWYWVGVIALEDAAGARIVHAWLPAVPQWVFALVVLVALTISNLVSVRSFGEFEFWFAVIKVTAIVGFITLSVLAILGLIPGVHAPGTSVLTGHGGILPHGPAAVLTGILIIVGSFVGTEIVTIAAAESDEPQSALRAAMRDVVWRILVFYIGSMLVIVVLVPWNSDAVGNGPFLAVLRHLNIPGGGQIVTAVALTAVLSALNSSLYTASRMMFSMAQRREAPRRSAVLARNGIPRAAVLGSAALGLVAVFFNYVAPDTVFLFIQEATSTLALFVYIGIAVTQLAARRRADRDGTSAPDGGVAMWGFPWVTISVIVALAGVVVGMMFDSSVRDQVLLSLLVAAFVVIGAHLNDRFRRRAQAETAESCTTGAVR
jgi:gamma-aminobutyrate permease